MIVYVAQHWSAQDGVVCEWRTSRREAEKALTRLRRDHGPHQGWSEVIRHEIPPTKDGLVRWLNDNFDHLPQAS